MANRYNESRGRFDERHDNPESGSRQRYGRHENDEGWNDEPRWSDDSERGGYRRDQSRRDEWNPGMHNERLGEQGMRSRTWSGGGYGSNYGGGYDRGESGRGMYGGSSSGGYGHEGGQSGYGGGYGSNYGGSMSGYGGQSGYGGGMSGFGGQSGYGGSMSGYGGQSGYGGGMSGYGGGMGDHNQGSGRGSQWRQSGQWGQSGQGGQGQWSSQYGQGQSSRRGGSGPHSGKGPKGYTRSDDRIREEISDELMAAGDVDASEIEIQVSNGEVTLSGTVDSRDAKRRAEELIEDIQGVRDVQNHLKVQSGHDSGSQGSGSMSGSSRGSSTIGSSGSAGSTGSSGQSNARRGSQRESE